MSHFAYPTLAAAVLLAGVGVANAQTAQDHDAHHPENASPAQAAPAMPRPPSGGMAMDRMMGGGNMEQMAPMMRMMRGMGGGGGEMRMMPYEHVDGRIAFLKTELKITDDQLPQWNAFADALRTGATAMRGAMGNMQSSVTAAMPARLDAMVAMVTARLEGLKATASAAKSLYAVLTETQKKTADDLIMSPMGGM